MISRAVLVALFSALVTALSPAIAPTDDDCALYLTGPGRSSAYDYSLNLLKGNFAYDGHHTCITYDAVNQAYLDARTRILVSVPKGDWHAEHFASVGELILDISVNLARTYGLTYEEIEKGLPLIDTSRTLIREVCPPVFSHVECRAGKYRRLDGLCNNLQHPTWGATMAPFQRLIGPLFADGINSPRISHSGRDLPLSRVVSRTMHPDDGFHDHAGTVMVIAWGQFMDHDYTLTGTPLDPVNRNDPEECCKRPLHLKHPYCNEILIPDDDYFYRLFGVKCIDFVRGFPSPRPGCKLGSRNPFNTLTGVIDGNTVYGVTEKFARKLRTGYGGLLRMNPVFKEYGLKDLLPLKLDIPDEGCTRPNKNMYCFEAGEIRVNEQLVLTVMHTLMAREHNRVAQGLAQVNPHWDDETLFQEARRINIAEIQHITYNEFLPILLGKDVMEKFGLVLAKEGHWDGYDAEVNPDVIASFAAAAYRFGHSLLPTAVERWSKAHKFIASKRLSDLIRRPYDLYRAGVLDEYVMGLMNQVAQAMDDSITQEVTNHLFKKVGARFGMDLVSFNMQRGREFGLPGYMEFRKFCGLSDANTFQDLFGSMPNETVRKYESIFEHPIDVDLWSGGVSERPLPGSMLGPTFACVIATQFSYSRRGDRFWFELPNQPSSFTPEQLVEIRKSRLARVICDNTDIIDTVQLYPMVLPDHELNPRVPCRSGILPSMDFSKWAEVVPFAGAAKQYTTDALIQPKPIQKDNTYSTGCVNSNSTCKNNISTILDDRDCNATLADNEINPIPCMQNVNTTKSINNSDCLKQDVNTGGIVSKDLKVESKLHIQVKAKGHYKNSLRRKRSAPAVYDYVTSHDPKNNNPKELKETIKRSDIADYNTEHIFNNRREPTKFYKSSDNYQEKKGKDLYRNIEEKRPAETNFDNSQETDKSTETLYNKPETTHPDTVVKNDSGESDETNGKYYRNPDRNSSAKEIKNHSDESDGNNRKYYAETSHAANVEKSDSGESSQTESSDESNEKYSTPKKIQNESSELESLNDSNDYYSKPKTSRNGTSKLITTDSGESSQAESLDESDEKHYVKPESSQIGKKKLKKNDAGESSEVETLNESNEKYYAKPEKKRSSTTKLVKGDPGHLSPVGSYNENQDNLEFTPSRHNDDKKTYFNKPSNLKKQVSNEDSEDKVIPLEKSEIPSEINSSSEENLGTSNNFGDVQPKTSSPTKIINDESLENVNSNESFQNENKNEESNKSKDKIFSENEFLNDKVTEDNNSTIKNSESIKRTNSDKRSDPALSSDFLNKETHETQDLDNINDRKVRPVIELNVENTSEESNEKTSNKLTDYQADTSTKISSEEQQKKSKLKQQFERIPLDYKHDELESNKTAHIPETKNIPVKTENEEATSSGNDDLDENLNIKFSDISITLPEINLPDDILAYNYEVPSYTKHPSYTYNDNEDDNRKSYKHNPVNDDNSYYGYGNDFSEKNQKERNSYTDKRKQQNKDDEQEEEEEEDLYEKFVRERFGKKVSEIPKNSKYVAPNPELYKTLQNVLKKTETIQKEAENSKDPNAGYAWTLEYGQNL